MINPKNDLAGDANVVNDSDIPKQNTEIKSDNIENIANEDWPLLKELESTRFSLKNKKSSKLKQALEEIKVATEKEDDFISQQNTEDEKKMEKFFDDQNLKELKEESISVVEKKIEINENNYSVEKVVEPEVVKNVEVLQTTKPIQTQKSEEIKTVQKVEQKPNDNVRKLIALGMAKIFVNKTDNMLEPLRFLMANSMMVIVALIQFTIPAILTWYAVTHIEIIEKQLAKEFLHVYIVYVGIFYFACLFLWISVQVLLQGIWNMVKSTMSSLAKEGKD